MKKSIKLKIFKNSQFANKLYLEHRENMINKGFLRVSYLERLEPGCLPPYNLT
jgi:hypothetical protein